MAIAANGFTPADGKHQAGLLAYGLSYASSQHGGLAAENHNKASDMVHNQ